MRAFALVLGLLVAVPAAAQDDCTTSPTGAYSFTVGVAAGAGRRALYDVRVSRGASCDEAAIHGWATLSSFRRLAVTDGGVLVSILAPRTSHRDWPIVMLTRVAARPRDATQLRLALQDLGGTSELGGSVAASFDGDGVVFRARDHEARFSFSELEALFD